MLEDATLVRQVARSHCELPPDTETYIELLEIGKVDAVLFRATVPPPDTEAYFEVLGIGRGRRRAL